MKHLPFSTNSHVELTDPGNTSPREISEVACCRNIPCCMTVQARNNGEENTQVVLFHLALLIPYLKAVELRWILLGRL